MNTSTTSVSAVNWSEIFGSNKSDVVEFVNGTLSFRDFKKRCTGSARKEVLTLEKNRGAVKSRQLARRACQYRKVAVKNG